MKTRVNILALVTILFLSATVFAAGVPGYLKERMGTLNGEFHVENKPLPNATLSFFNTTGGPPPNLGNARRVPDLVSRADADGKFSVPLPPGMYFMGALIREKGAGPGPPRPGEKFFFARNPDGKMRIFTVKAKQTTETGIIAGIAPERFEEFQSYMTIRGKVKDADGKPLGGIIVTLNDNLNSARPKFISGKTNEDGTYEVKVPPGKYYVVAHESIRGGRPTPGSKIGMYGRNIQPGSTPSPNTPGGGPGNKMFPGSAAQSGTGNEVLPVAGQEGDLLEHIDIIMLAVPDPEKMRQKYLDEAQERKKGADVQEEPPPAKQQ